MRRQYVVLMQALALALTIACRTSSAAMQPGVPLQADGKDIDGAVGHLVPTTTDWNGDGRKDLIVGQFGGGKIKLYLNTGTDAAPVFKDAGFLHAGGKIISLPAG